MGRFILMFLLLYSSATLAGTSYCDELNIRTKDLGWHRPYIAKVIGSGRLYLFSGPDTQCKNKKLFIVPTDKVTVYSEYAGYSQISYSSKTDDYSAWVTSNRLKIIAKPDETITP